MSTTRRPNVILILTDDQGYGDMSCHGHPFLKTPNLDRLHDESVRLTDFHVAPMCTPSRSALMSGVDPLKNGAMATSLGRNLLKPELATVADHFHNGGYRTGIFGKWHLGSTYPYRPMDRGFEEAVYHLGFGLTGVEEWWNNDYYDPWYLHNGERKQGKGYCTDFWFDRAMDWMGQRGDSEEPFFCYLPTNVPHFPMWIEDQYREQFYPHLEDAKPDAAGFYGMIVELDENLARLDRFLEEKGLKEDTILLFITDNGHAGGALNIYNAGMRGGKCSRYEGGHRVPCFIRWPGGDLRPAGDVATPSQGQDILPTLLDLCGVPFDEPDAIDGRTLGPLLRGDDGHLADRKFVVQYFQNSVDKDDACVAWKKWRLVHGKELYDLTADPGQENDVADRHPEVVASLQEFYEGWWTEVEPGIHDFSPVYLGAEAQPEVMITSSEWQNVRADGAGNPRTLGGRAAYGEDARKGAPWNVRAEREASYRVELRRYPREAGLALTEASPEFRAVAGTIDAGVEAPIAGGRMVVDGAPLSFAEDASDEAVVFRVPLGKGHHQIHGWFVDADGEPVCGAYYAYVRAEG